MASIWSNNGRLYIGYTDVAGVRHQECLKLPDTKAGWLKARAIKKRLEAEMVVNPVKFWAEELTRKRKTLLSEVMQELEADEATLPESKRRSKSMMRGMHLALKKFEDTIGDLPVQAVRSETLKQFRGEAIRMDGESNTANYLRHLSPLFTFARKRGLIPASPFSSDVHFRVEPAEVVPIPHEIREGIFLRIQQERGVDYERQFRFLLLTGCRPEDSCLVKRSDLDFEDRFIRLPNKKGKRREPYPMYLLLYDFLQPYRELQSEKFIFPIRGANTLSHYWAEARDALGIERKYRLYGLKKTYARTLAQGHIHQLVAQDLFHHKSLTTTKTHYIGADLDFARAEMDRIAPLLEK